MEESRTPNRASSTDDIATEPYKGPSALVASVGHGAIEHLVFAVVGLFSAGTLAYIFHRPAASLVKKCQNAGTWLKEYSPEGQGIWNRSKDNVTTWAGSFLHVVFGDVEAAVSLRQLEGHASNALDADRMKYIAMNKEQGFGNWFVSHTIGSLPYVGKRFKANLHAASDRTTSAIAVGGVAGVAGYVGGWLKAVLTGAKDGNLGKTQFESAQSEIKHQREKCGELERSKQELSEKLAAQQNAAKEERVVAPEPTVPVSKPMADAVDSAPSTAKLEAAEHKGMLAAERAAEPAMA